MFALSRCLATLRPSSSVLQHRTFSALTRTLPTRPTLLPRTVATPTNTELVSNLLQPTSQSGLAVLQIRGAKRDTFNPSHLVRKRRHGFLSRNRTRTGRMTLKRRRAKGRNTLSH